MKRVKKIGLAKLFLWSEAERIQTYPEAFAKLDGSCNYTRYALATEIFGLVYRDQNSNRPVRGDQIKNCFGLEPISDEKVVIRGINCLRQVDKDHFRPTEDALAIGREYKMGKDQDKWVILLARQVARFEVRTRLLLYLLGQEGWCLTFPTPGFFGLPSVKTRLLHGNESIVLFENRGKEFNRLLENYRQVALGPWWRRELAQAGYEIDDDFRFEGIKHDPPPTNKLNSNIKGSMFLLKYLAIVEGQNNGWVVCPEKAVEILGETVASDFVETKNMLQSHSPLSILKSLMVENRDGEGFVVVSRLARSWAINNGVPPHKAQEAFDQFMREQIYEGTVRIVARHHGQPRHGRGLFGEEAMRKIKIEFS